MISFRNEFDTRGPMSLFNIARRSEITSEDLENAKQIVDFYVGSKGIWLKFSIQNCHSIAVNTYNLFMTVGNTLYE